MPVRQLIDSARNRARPGAKWQKPRLQSIVPERKMEKGFPVRRPRRTNFTCASQRGTPLPVHFSHDNIDTTDDRHDIGDETALHHLAHTWNHHERRRPEFHPVRDVATITDDIKSDFAPRLRDRRSADPHRADRTAAARVGPARARRPQPERNPAVSEARRGATHLGGTTPDQLECQQRAADRLQHHHRLLARRSRLSLLPR